MAIERNAANGDERAVIGVDAAANPLDVVGARREVAVCEASDPHSYQSGKSASGYATSSLMALVT